MYVIVRSQHRSVYLEGNSTLIEVDNGGNESRIPLEEFWTSDAPNMAKAHLLSVLRQCNPLQEFAVMIAPLFGGEVYKTPEEVLVFFYHLPVIVEKANAYIPQVYAIDGHDAEIRACDFLNHLL